MSRVPIARLAAAALLFHALPALAERIEIDLPAALDRAHARAGVARARAAAAAELRRSDPSRRPS